MISKLLNKRTTGRAQDEDGNALATHPEEEGHEQFDTDQSGGQTSMDDNTGEHLSDTARGSEDGAPSADRLLEGLPQDSELEAEHDEELEEGAVRDETNDINVETFEELHMGSEYVDAAKGAWKAFLSTAETREAAGEAIYVALFDGAPSLQPLFTTPRAVQAMKFMNGLASFVGALDDPSGLRTLVETLGFGHLHLDVTVPRVCIFRDAILDLFEVELAEKYSAEARMGWTKLLNYVGGAIIFVKAHYADRMNTLLASWKTANSGGNHGDKGLLSGSMDSAERLAENQKLANSKAKDASGARGAFSFGSAALAGRRRRRAAAAKSASDNESDGRKHDGPHIVAGNQVPTTYDSMFKFNATVMGFGHNAWLHEVLACFHNIVVNVSNSQRLQEECDVLVLRISKVARNQVNFGEYKSCMLASLRSLLPKDWSTAHEVAWTWLWENVERLLMKNMGNPPKWEKALARIWGKLDDAAAFEVRKDIYHRFFAVAPAGQDYFKQSNTYLHFIAERIMSMSLEIYREPVKMVDDISALGLRHVGYAIPVELFGPFVTVCVEAVMSKFPEDQEGIEAFRWSLALISKMLTRTITEGSTVVMKAINSNSTRQLKRALSCAPRCERCSWMLIVQVGTQSISPLAWAVESGALEAGAAMITDLLTIRADRDRYYCGLDDLFKRHPDIVKKLCDNAPTLLPTLLDRLIWRARTTENGMRRVNYYIKHLLVDQDGKFSPTLGWLAKTKDPKLVCHPVLVLLSDIIWTRVASKTFLSRKSWFLFTLLVFIGGQSILRYVGGSEGDGGGQRNDMERTLLFAFRAFIYIFSMTQLLYVHGKRWIKELRRREVTIYGCIPLPNYLRNWQDVAGLFLMMSLVAMLALEPILWCLQDTDVPTFAEECTKSDPILYSYSIFSMLSMLLYFALLIDLAVLSTKVSAYVLVCIRMLSEVWLFILALVSLLLTFGSSLSVVEHDLSSFRKIHKGMLSLLEIALGMTAGDQFGHYENEPIVAILVFVFLVAATIFLVNMLIAQLTCAYEAVYSNMVGYARLERVEIIVVTMPVVSDSRWKRFLRDCNLDCKIEFGSGDLGLAGGIKTSEAANLNLTTFDTIRRFGGSTSPEMQWPQDDDTKDVDDRDRLGRMEKLLQKTLKRLTKNKENGSKGGGSQGATGNFGSGSGSAASGSDASVDE